MAKIIPFTRILLTEFDDHQEGPAGEDLEFTLPEDLTALDDEALTALESTATEAFDAIYDDGEQSLDAEAVADLRSLRDAITEIRGEQTRRSEAAAAAAEEAAALAAEVRPTDEDGTTDETVEGAAEDTEEAAADTEGAATEQPAESTEVQDEESVAVAASAQRRPVRVPLSRIRERAPRPDVAPEMGDVVITAAADLPGLTPNSRFESPERVAVALHDRARNLGNGQRAPVATFQRQRTHVIEDGMSQRQMSEVLASARDPHSLVAAGGWCAPSTTLYDLFSIEAVTGLVDIPTVTVERGGIEFPEDGGPSIADVFSVPWLWTEANDIAATGGTPTKSCTRIPCVEFAEEVLDAHGICITHGNLANRAYPELTTRYIGLVMAAHEHLINQRIIAAMVANSDAVTIGATASAASPILAATDLQAQDYREKFRMDEDALLETVYPMWTKGLIRSDLARRNGVDLLSVTMSDIQRYFAARNVRPQFVYDWQNLQDTAGATGDGFAETWPTTMDFMLYAAGTHVRGNGGSIDLGVVRDSTLNETNDYTAAWTEEFILTAKMGHESRVVSLSGLCPDGEAGGSHDLSCPIA